MWRWAGGDTGSFFTAGITTLMWRLVRSHVPSNTMACSPALPALARNGHHCGWKALCAQDVGGRARVHIGDVVTRSGWADSRRLLLSLASWMELLQLHSSLCPHTAGLWHPEVGLAAGNEKPNIGPADFPSTTGLLGA